MIMKKSVKIFKLIQLSRIAGFGLLIFLFGHCVSQETMETRERISINNGWHFYKYPENVKPDSLIYDERPEVKDRFDAKQADSKPTEAVVVEKTKATLKAWIMPTGNAFLKGAKPYVRPEGNPGADFPFVQPDFNDSSWEKVNLPHDWAIKGPFYEGWDAPVGGGMGRLPVQGVAWYRRNIDIPSADKGKSIFLDIDGAMSYAMVWLNGNLVGGWPYGYASFRLDLTPYINYGGKNILAIRLDNPENSSRWYPGAGLYRNVWLVKTNRVHIGHWGTFVNTEDVSKEKATVNFEVTVENDADQNAGIEVASKIYLLDKNGNKVGNPVAELKSVKTDVDAHKTSKVKGSVTIENPKLWGPPPTQQPNLYVIVTSLSSFGKQVDTYETTFGFRDLRFVADSGLYVNGEHIYLKGVNQHHDLGALGAAFNYRAAQRQLEILRDMGCNAIRMSHNPPAPELLELTDKMGFLVIDEIFDCWERKKTPLDFHLIFPDWHEQDLRAFIQRDRNHPSVFMWSLGNEVGEQYTDEAGAKLARQLKDIARDADSTRLTSISLNFAKPPMPLPGVMDVVCLNYQGEGIRDAPAYEHLRKGRISTPPLYPSFHEAYPDKLIISSENASAFSSRGEYIFPVYEGISAPAEDGNGGDPKTCQVSSYELYTAQFGASADKVFRSLDQHPYVGGGFVWSGWDYLGEPTPYYQARSSYCGIIDLAGFKKDRYYLYQSRWCPDLPMAHILPHWNWPDRVGKVTPVHVFTSGDAAELFLNGKSLGKRVKGQYEYRLRWDSVIYKPGQLKVIAFKKGKAWAEDSVKTNSEAASLNLKADRTTINADGKDLSFITVEIHDQDGGFIRNAMNEIEFSIEGAGEIVATDNGDPMDFTPFPSLNRKAFNGLALVIVRTLEGKQGTITLKASSPGLESASVTLESK